jgi:prepilin-type N-terminal cleavage/methylation domain-containing protein
MRRARQGGFTLIELMISLIIASLVVGFIFRIYATSSAAYRSQSQVAEVMQTLRTAKQTLTKKLRLAGYYAGAINTLVNTGTQGHSSGGTVPATVYLYSPVSFVNSNSGPDEIHIVYADTTCTARVSNCDNCPPFNAAESRVESTQCFHEGDVVMAVRLADGVNGTKKGWGCVLQITLVQDNPALLQHRPAAPYNDTQNQQCDHIAPDWKDGQTAFMRFKSEGYRLKPSDARGVLQYSPTAGVSNDWQDLAFGFVDMQFAVQMYEPNDTADADGVAGPDGTLSPIYDWYSGSNLNNIDLSTGKEMMQIRVSLIARTVAEVEGAGTRITPSLLGDSSRPNNNPIGDHDSVTISTVTDTSSPYYGNYLYRMSTTVVDLRNLGVGRVL